MSADIELSFVLAFKTFWHMISKAEEKSDLFGVTG